MEEALALVAISNDHAEKWSSLNDHDYPHHPSNYSIFDLVSTYWATLDQSTDLTNYCYQLPEAAMTSNLDQEQTYFSATDHLLHHDVSNSLEYQGVNEMFLPEVIADQHEGKNLETVGEGGNQNDVLIPKAFQEEACLKSKKRSSIQVDAQKKKRNAKGKKNQKLDSSIDHATENNPPDAAVNLQGQSSSSSVSEDDSTNTSNSSSSIPGSAVTAVNSNGKTRASRGSATDPQSVYARRRRERINERLRILQNLVPNGTKVDISTMLEEAVQYVKFLQLQIKLLSSDELWMYAPIAYNGRNIGLDLSFLTPKSS